MTEFRAGDRVRVTYETTVRNDFGDYTGKYLLKGPTAQNRNVELIERADDPSKDLVGTVRSNGTWIVINEGPFWRFHNHGGTVRGHRTVIGWKVIGAVPGTQAAEAQKPAERPLWTGDGSEEPPEYVTAVRSTQDGDVCERNGHGWWWVGPNRDAAPEREAHNGWAWRNEAAWGPYTEVRDA